MNWANYTLLGLYILGLGIAIEKHNKPREGKHSIWIDLISVVLHISLLYFGGFFR